MNPLYQSIMSKQMGNYSVGPVFSNPMQKMNYIMQAMQNPAAFVKQAFPDIPAEIQNNPNQILSYLQQTRHISNEQIQSIQNQLPRWY